MFTSNDDYLQFNPAFGHEPEGNTAGVGIHDLEARLLENESFGRNQVTSQTFAREVCTAW